MSTLTPEQRAEENEYQDYVGRVVLRSAPVLMLLFIGAILLLDRVGPRALTGMVAMLSVPMSFSLPFFLFVKRKSDWRRRL